MRAYTGGAEDLHVFRGFNGRLVAKNPGSTAPGPDKIAYDKMLRFMGLWFSGVLGTPVALFKKQFAMQSGRSGCKAPHRFFDIYIDSLDVSRKSKNRFESMLLGRKIDTVMIRT